MKKQPIGILLLLLIVIAGIWLFMRQPASEPAVISDDGALLSGTTTVRGTFVCLPHKDASGPQTMECAYGMKASDGNNYALDWSGTPVSAFDLPMEREYSVTGLYVPVETLNSDHWRIYDIRGIIRVSSYEEIASSTPVIPATDSPVTLELNKPVMIGGEKVTVGAVLQDSRCPSDVTCIQAGKVVAAASFVSGMGTSSAMQIEPGKTVTTETHSFTLDKVTPYPVSTRKIADSEYRFVFTVKPL